MIKKNCSGSENERENSHELKNPKMKKLKTDKINIKFCLPKTKRVLTKAPTKPGR